MSKFAGFKFAGVVLGVTVLVYTAAQAQEPRPVREVLENSCTTCHGLNRIQTQKARDEWEETVRRMILTGADVTPEESTRVIAYLTRYYGEDVNVNKASAEDMVRELVIPKEEAEAIVAYRKASGDFKAFEDLGKVKGIDLKKYEPIRDRITF